MKVALVQLNLIVGDVAGNHARLAEAITSAAKQGAELAVCSELALVGYPPRDLVEDRALVDANLRLLDDLARHAPIPVIVGFVGRDGAGLRNAAAVLEGGRVASVHYKSLLPTYDVFDEARYFQPASERHLATVAGKKVALTICEDNWNDADFWPRRKYGVDPVAELAAKSPDLLVTISASPFSWGKRALRQGLWAAQAKKYGVPLIAVNQVGGNDDLIFDGGSVVFDKQGQVRARCKEFAEDTIVVEVDLATGAVKGPLAQAHPTTADGELGAVLDALIVGTRDYASKCGFLKSGVVIGLSGGVDSAVTCAIAVAAIGPDKVWGVAMPSRYSSDHSLSDAEALAKNLGVRFDKISIEKPFTSFLETLAPVFQKAPLGLTEENLQARARGVILMALSNKFGNLVLSTGNKSELAVGYCTLYGDMSGGLAILSDVFKTTVYRLADEINRRAGKDVIPRSSITKPPSAELRPDQTDQDSLPPYPILDGILDLLIEEGATRDDIIAHGFEPAVVDDVIKKFRGSEYKRYQAAPGLKVTDKAFGPGRRMPLAAVYRLA